MDDTAGRMRALARRIEVLEQLVMRAVCLAVAGLLIAGCLVPFGYGTEAGEPVAPSVLTMPVHMLAAAGEPGGDTDELTFVVTATIGFAGLLLVVLAILGTLLVFARRDGGDGTLKLARILRALALIGTAAVLIFTLMYVGDREAVDGPGWGGVVLLVGVVAYSMLLSEPWRGLWHRPLTPVRQPPRATRSASAQPRDDSASSTGR